LPAYLIPLLGADISNMVIECRIQLTYEVAMCGSFLDGCERLEWALDYTQKHSPPDKARHNRLWILMRLEAVYDAMGRTKDAVRESVPDCFCPSAFVAVLDGWLSVWL
jgi:hypothetical protein